MTRIIIASMALSIAVFATVAVAVRRGGFGGDETVTELAGLSGLAVVWALLALGSGAAAVFIWRNAADRVAAARRGRTNALGSEWLVGRLTMAAALFEGPALMGVVAFLLEGGVIVLVGASAVGLAGLALIFPSADWFHPLER